ncbi:MAG: HupE/UreJ family protein [Lentisphaeraceae bacterium]|nr:HupE/UreJ family protein [Lentisphaeraceae bacterium]
MNKINSFIALILFGTQLSAHETELSSGYISGLTHILTEVDHLLPIVSVVVLLVAVSAAFRSSLSSVKK